MDVLEHVKALAARSQAAPVPAVDVRTRVCATLREAAVESVELLDKPSLAFAGLSVAVVAILFTLFLPSIQILWDPWAAYMSAPWSI